MKKLFISLLVLLLGIGLFFGIKLILKNNVEAFYLDELYYEDNKLIDVDMKDLGNLIDNKASFALFVYQPACETSAGLNKVINKFLDNNKISFYKVSFSDFTDDKRGEFLEYFPSFVIYKDGEVVDYLESDNDDDLNIYKNYDDFSAWFLKYVKVREKLDGKDSSSKSIVKDRSLISKLDLNDLSYSKDKVNIYFFWGDGCPHCEAEHKFFDSIKSEYGKYYNLHTYEVWYNDENVKIFEAFAKAMGDDVDGGVPYTIIGSKSFSGFRRDKFIKAIKDEHKNSYDVYFEKR